MLEPSVFAARRAAVMAALGPRATLVVASLPERLRVERTGLLTVLSAVDLAKFARVAPDPGEVPRLAERALVTLDRLEALRQEPVVEPGLEPEPAREAAS